ncbi:Outer membrane vitamin B12 receptor BtuB [Thioalkalivibrio nitratireducens DSM 14787]|uniref:Outer membrane vitamin B12 receptor BtuB n=1 Tax=Thioalkalivibrio nitratireducens (strain DSM 14787 / UNIQEM 213 / ALEN2) TaxID=1255043 RepID=L0DZV2_THIND|nr:TonB-dependent receptor [Thioalkalivibrio nitratireducens]AGA35129.1 Outer membrane vitamin B12 receptor BtuB [Thioalkalivibrio nitratireducens DSM 14787]
MKIRRLPVATVLAGVTFISPVHLALATELEPIIVTATRTAQTVDESLSAVTVIEREEIERLQPAQFVDLLRNRAGISVADTGPFGKATGVFLRGTNSDHTLLLVDGVRMGSATMGSASWQFLPPSEIERIEIVRGPRASTYGADAIGGVIQVFTRKGAEGPARFNAYSRIGSFNTREAGVGLQGGNRSTRFSLSADHQQTDGINVRDEVGDNDRDGFRNTSLASQLSHRFDNGLELFGNLLRSQGRTEFDGFEDETDFVHQALRAGVRGDLAETWHSELTIGQSRDENDNFGQGQFSSRFDTRRDMADWRNDLLLGESLLWTVGLDWQQDRVESTVDFDETRRYNRAIYQVLQAELGRHDLQGSLRHDDNEAYGGNTTGQVAWGFRLTENLQSRASYGTAFKAPTFNQLYWPGDGNPDLDPEKSETLEGGLRYAHQALYWEASLFQTDVRNLISGWPPANIDKARIRGLEFETGLHRSDWHAAAALTLLDAEDRDTGNELARRPRATLRLDLDRQMGDFSVGGTVIARGRSFDYDWMGNAERLAGHALLNLRASWQLAPQWTLRATVDNVTDKDYQTAAGFNQPGRAAYLSVHFQQ